MVEFRTASKGRKEYPKVIMPEEKDKILYELLNKEENGFYFEYKNVPDLNISMVQFEKVMIELEDMGMLKLKVIRMAVKYILIQNWIHSTAMGDLRCKTKCFQMIWKD